METLSTTDERFGGDRRARSLDGHDSEALHRELRALERESRAADLGHARSVLRRWRGILLVLPLLGAVVGGAVAISAPDLYTARAIVLIDPDDARVLEDAATSAAQPQRRIETEAALLASPALEAQIQERLGVDVRYEVTVGAGSNVVTIETEEETAELAAERANGVAEAFIAERRQIDRERLEESVIVVNEEITRLEAELADIEAEVAGEDSPSAVIVARRAALSDQAATLETRVNELEIESEVSSGNPRLAGRAVPQDTRAGRTPVLGVLVGLVVGLAVAGVLVLLGERYSPTPDRTVEAVAREPRSRRRRTPTARADGA